jgi:hypothetical protein
MLHAYRSVIHTTSVKSQLITLLSSILNLAPFYLPIHCKCRGSVNYMKVEDHRECVQSDIDFILETQ